MNDFVQHFWDDIPPREKLKEVKKSKEEKETKFHRLKDDDPKKMRDHIKN